MRSTPLPSAPRAVPAPLIALLAALCCAACARGGSRESSLAPGEPWFRREAWRPDPAPPPEPPPEKIPTPPESERPVVAPPSLAPFAAAPGFPAGDVLPAVPGDSADTVTLKDKVAGTTLRGKTIQASARSAIMAYQGGGPYVGTRIQDCVIKVEPGTLPDDRSFWGFRGYDLSDTTLAAVEITGFGRVTPKHDEGHAIYVNVIGDLTLEDCDVHHNGGQGLQVVRRASESVVPASPAQGAITIRRSRFRENGFNPDRAGFQISIFGTGQDVTLDHVELVAGRDATPYPAGAPGALLIEPEAPNPETRNVWWQPGADGLPPFTQGRVVLDGVAIDHVAPNRPIAQVKGCRELVVTGGTFRGGRVELDAPGLPGRPSGTITWSGNAGDAEVWVGGELAGTADVDFTATDGVIAR